MNIKIKISPLLFLVVPCFIAFSSIVIMDFKHPLFGLGDIDYWEYTGFYLAKNFSLFPIPHLDLNNNQAFYPYGVNQVFQPWVFEMDFFFAILYSHFGFGPWLQIYYLLTVIITYLGTFILLRTDYSIARAMGVAFIASFCNFYAIYKYPEHLSYAVCHWVILSIIADFILFKRVVNKEYISLRFILLRILLLILSLGQELGYVIGCALTSFTIGLTFIFLLTIYRILKGKLLLKKTINNYLNLCRREIYIYGKIITIQLISIFIFSYLYIPILLQIFRSAKSFDFTQVSSDLWWSSSWRFLIPFLPFFNSINNSKLFLKLFQDSPESFIDSSPGLFLVIIGSIGLWQSRKTIILYLPLITIFLLFISYHPLNFPILKLFPWFSFARVTGRFSIAYPVILSLFALNVNLSYLKLSIKRTIIVFLIALACTELYTSYSLNLYKNQWMPTFALNQSFFEYMNYVKNRSGEAVLDWPFCITGGNGVGGASFCPLYLKNGSIFALRRFHEKKVMGQYFGRLHPQQLNDYIEAGWDKLFVPNNPEFPKATYLECFRPEAWDFFTRFYEYNDFAGINLYVDLLPKQCVDQFHARFGQPAITTVIPGLGKVEFIQKTEEQRKKVNPLLGKTIKFEPLLDISQANLLEFHYPYGMDVKGLDVRENNQVDRWRWGLGQETKLTFKLGESKSLNLDFEFVNPIESQEVIIEINKSILTKIENIQKDKNIKLQTSFVGVKGVNTVKFIYKFWNHNQGDFAPQDPRKLAVLFRKLIIK